MLILIAFNVTGLELSLDNVKDIALEKSPQYLATKHNWKAAEMEMWNSALSLIPSASLDGSLTQYDPSFMMADELRSYSLSISQPLFNGGKIWLGYKIKKDAARMAEIQYLNQKFETIATVEEYYFNILESQNLIEIAQTDLTSSNINLNIAKGRYESGTLSQADYYQIQSENASKYVNLIQIKNLHSINKKKLANYLSIDADFSVKPVNFQSFTEELESVNTISFEDLTLLESKWKREIENHNPTLLIADINRKISKKSVLMAGGNFLPSLNVSFSRTWDKYNYEDEYSDSDRLMLIASLPIFPIADNATDYIKAKHQYRQTDYESIQIEDGVMLSLESALATLVASAKAIDAASKAKEYAEITYNQATERFKNNMISTADLLSIEVMLYSARTEYITSFFDYLSVRSLLQKLIQNHDDSKFLELLNK